MVTGRLFCLEAFMIETRYDPVASSVSKTVVLLRSLIFELGFDDDESLRLSLRVQRSTIDSLRSARAVSACRKAFSAAMCWVVRMLRVSGTSAAG